MNQFTILNKKEIKSILTMDMVIEAVEQAYSYKCSNLAELFPIVCHSFEDGVSEFDIKSGSMDGAGTFGMKLVSAFAGNSDLGLPRLTGTILIFDRKTGHAEKHDGWRFDHQLAHRSGGCCGCKYLARPRVRRCCCWWAPGAQGPVLLEATLKVMKNIKRILISNPHSPHKVPAFIDEIRPSLTADVDILPGEDLEAAVRSADIILTATPSRRALILDQWLKPEPICPASALIWRGSQELEEQILGRAKVFCDDLKQVVAVGECEKAVKQGILPVQHSRRWEMLFSVWQRAGATSPRSPFLTAPALAFRT